MPEKDIFTFSYLTYLLAFLFSSWGGIVSYLGKVNNGITRRFSITELVGEVCTSGFVGIVTFLLCQSAHIDQLATAALVGISGHMGSRTLFLLETMLQKRFLKQDEK